MLYGGGVAARVRDVAGGPVDAVFDVAGKTPIKELISLVAEPSRVLCIANFAAGETGAQVTGGGADSRPIESLAEVGGLLTQNKLVIKVQAFPFSRAAEAYRLSRGGHVRGKLVLVEYPLTTVTTARPPGSSSKAARDARASRLPGVGRCSAVLTTLPEGCPQC